MGQDNETKEFQTGAQLLLAWNCTTREAKLERACLALMEQLNNLHTDHLGQSLEIHLTNTNVFCSCADAYRMGHEALKR